MKLKKPAGEIPPAFFLRLSWVEKSWRSELRPDNYTTDISHPVQ